MIKNKSAQTASGYLSPNHAGLFSVLDSPWFIEGIFYSTFIAIIWTNEEPSKLNTILAAWSAYAIIAFAMYQGIKTRTIINPTRWVRVYFTQSLLLLLVCDFVWLRGTIPRAPGDYFDPIRFDYIAARLSNAGLDPMAISLTNHTGTIWYAGFIYWLFGVSKFYVVLFNGALSFVTWILFTSIMSDIEGNPLRWQWLCFGALLPDFIIYFANVSKGPLSAFVVALGVWLISWNIRQNKIFAKSIILLIPVLLLGITIRAATSVIILIVALIWLWQYSKIKRRFAITILFSTILVSGQFITSYILKITGSMDLNFISSLSILSDPALRHRVSLDYQPDSWNAITESFPVYLMPLVAFIKGAFMMLAPMPIWNLHLDKIFNDVALNSNYGSIYIQEFSLKINALLFLLSFPFLIASLFDAHRSNRRLWVLLPLTFMILIGFMGFTVFGMIEARYRAMILPFWLSACGIGYYYGRPGRYVMPTVGILAFGAIIYLIPKIL